MWFDIKVHHDEKGNFFYKKFAYTIVQVGLCSVSTLWFITRSHLCLFVHSNIELLAYRMCFALKIRLCI